MSLPVKLLSTLWSGISLAARGASKRGLLPCEDLGVRVLSVGNIEAGGTGKTPLVALIANEAHARGLRACILSRGYRGQWERSGGLIRPGSPAPRPEQCGDEPALLHELAPHAWIAVGRDRVAGYREAAQASRFDLVVLDDGFQHWKIRKDVEIIARTSADPSEKVFRDFESQIGKADLIVWTKGAVRPDSRGKPMAQVSFRLPRSQNGDVIWLVTGVAQPEHVREAAEAAGYRVARQITRGDHASYSRSQIDSWLEHARSQGAQLATTGKDWVKWQALGVAPGEVKVLEPEVEFVSGRDLWEKVLWERS